MTGATMTRVEDISDERAAAPSWLRRHRLLLIALGLALAAAAVAWAVWFSPLFGVASVEVHGTRALTVAQVRAAADVTDGTPLVRVDTAAIARRIARLPDVAVVDVRTSFPSSVVVTITERRAVAYLREPGRFVLVDRSGSQFRAVAARPVGLPRLVLPAGRGATATGAAEAAVALALPPSLATRVRSIEALDPSSISLVLTHGVLVRWGTPDRSADKIAILPTLLTQKVTTDGVPVRPSQIDVTNPDQPFVR